MRRILPLYAPLQCRHDGQLIFGYRVTIYFPRAFLQVPTDLFGKTQA